MNELSRTKQKTRANFIDALFLNLAGKPLEKITVRDIVTTAGYNRSSFYLYFTDVYDLAGAAEDEVIKELSSAAEEQFATGKQISMEDFMQRLVAQASACADRISLLADYRTFRDKFMNLLRPTFARASGLDVNMDGYDYLVSLFFSIMLHNISYWSQHREEVDFPEVAEMSRNIFLPGIRQLHTMK